MLKLTLSFLTALSSVGNASCIELAKGNLEIKVERCDAIDTASLFASSRVQDAKLTPEAIDKLTKTYEGLLVIGTVTQSNALSVGSKTKKQALKGETKEFYLPAKFKKTCITIMGTTLKGEVVQNCCDGHMESPCLASTSYTFNPR